MWLSVLLVVDLHTRELLELRACDAWGPTAEWTIRTFASAIHREGRQPKALVHDHGTHFLGQFERQLRVLDIERRRTPVALPFVNGVAERAIKSVRLEMLNHVRVRRPTPFFRRAGGRSLVTSPSWKRSSRKSATRSEDVRATSCPLKQVTPSPA